MVNGDDGFTVYGGWQWITINAGGIFSSVPIQVGGAPLMGMPIAPLAPGDVAPMAAVPAYNVRATLQALRDGELFCPLCPDPSVMGALAGDEASEDWPAEAEWPEGQHDYKLVLGVEDAEQSSKAQIMPGQITFDAEGNDVEGSIYFSRHIHWPGNDLSGVTLGRGYDMGSRSESEISAHMLAAGISADTAEAIAKAHNLKGNAAAKFVTDNRLKIGIITQQQQVELFRLIYPEYVSRAEKNYNNHVSSLSGKLTWDSLDPVVRDVLVDFVYQGFTKGPSPMVAGMKNDIDNLIRYIEENAAINQHEPGRRRVKYLKENR